MKRISYLLLSILLIFALTACTGGEKAARDHASVSTGAEEETLHGGTSEAIHSNGTETKEVSTPKNENDGIDLPIVPN